MGPCPPSSIGRVRRAAIRAEHCTGREQTQRFPSITLVARVLVRCEPRSHNGRMAANRRDVGHWFFKGVRVFGIVGALVAGVVIGVWGLGSLRWGRSLPQRQETRQPGATSR